MSRVAIFIDGDNVSSKHGPEIVAVATDTGRVQVLRAYADATNGSGWSKVAGVQLIHAGSGKNAADILLSIDAIELAHDPGFDTAVIVSSDADFTHLAFRLRARGIRVIGLGEEKTPDSFRAACTAFTLLAPLNSSADAGSDGVISELDLSIKAIINENTVGVTGMLLSDLNGKLHSELGVHISTFPEKTWRNYFAQRPELYEVDPKGPEARVRFLPAGFKGRGPSSN